MTSVNHKQHIQSLLDKAEALLKDAEAYAIEHKVEESVYWDGPTYGMGGWINGVGTKYDLAGWQASSNSC